MASRRLRRQLLHSTIAAWTASEGTPKPRPQETDAGVNHICCRVNQLGARGFHPGIPSPEKRRFGAWVNGSDDPGLPTLSELRERVLRVRWWCSPKGSGSSWVLNARGAWREEAPSSSQLCLLHSICVCTPAKYYTEYDSSDWVPSTWVRSFARYRRNAFLDAAFRVRLCWEPPPPPRFSAQVGVTRGLS